MVLSQEGVICYLNNHCLLLRRVCNFQHTGLQGYKLQPAVFACGYMPIAVCIPVSFVQHLTRLQHTAWSSRTPFALTMLSHAVQAYPLDLVRTRLAAQTTSHYYNGIWHALSTIVREEGMFGLYRGLGATLTQVGPSLAMNYCAYETLRSYWVAHEPSLQRPTVSITHGSSSRMHNPCNRFSTSQTLPVVNVFYLMSACIGSQVLYMCASCKLQSLSLDPCKHESAQH